MNLTCFYSSAYISAGLNSALVHFVRFYSTAKASAELPFVGVSVNLRFPTKCFAGT
jgi:hypothetical protein